MRQNGQMKSDQIAISGPSPVVSMRGHYRRPRASVPAMADLLVCGDVLLASAHAPPLARGGVLLRDGAVAEVGERDALAARTPARRCIGGDGKLVLPGLVNAHHHGMGISTVQLGYPDPGPPEPGLRDTPFESWMGTMLGARRGRSVPRDALQGRAADRVRRHVAPAHALPLGRRRRPGRARLRRASCRRRSAPTASRVSASRSRRTGATARAWPTTATTRSSRPCPAGLRERARRIARSSMPAEAYVETIEALVRELAGDPLLSAQFAIMAPQWASDALAAGGRLGGRRDGRRHPPARAREPAAARLGRCLRRRPASWSGWPRSACWATAAPSPTASGCATPTSTCWPAPEPPSCTTASSNLRLAAGVAPLRRLVASGVSVALGLDDMGLADDDDMFAEVRLAHVLQRVHGEARAPAPAPGRGLRARLGRRRQGRRRRDGDRPARAGPARRCRRARPASAQRAVRRRRRRRLGAAARARRRPRTSTA